MEGGGGARAAKAGGSEGMSEEEGALDASPAPAAILADSDDDEVWGGEREGYLKWGAAAGFCKPSCEPSCSC